MRSLDEEFRIADHEKGDFVAHKNFSLSARVLYNDLPPEEGVKLAETLRAQSAICYSGKVQHAAYRDVEKLYYLRCPADQCLRGHGKISISGAS